MDWLAFDFGPQFGDNFRGFLFLKALKQKHRIRLTCWITPQLQEGLAGLMDQLGFVDRWLIQERSPRQSYEINHQILKAVLARGAEFNLANLTGGQGPDGKPYDKIIPTAEPWFTAKLLAGEPLEAPDPENQGEFLARLLQLSQEELLSAAPLFGERLESGGHICAGFCRPRPDDPKQPARGLIDQAWQAVLALGEEVYALDYQDWYAPPQTGIHDWRLKSWPEKVELLNRARLFIGLDGGLTHFAAACGCPTLSFYGSDGGEGHGLLVGPYPRQTRRGEHKFHSRFKDYLQAIRSEAI